ncbi:MAG: hypothetical protein EOP88_10540 [Verrucomicrobiaceae bacterium]|nr:MAG: hypothetical protein EOP88_10540 [Verrucomicrobiaceae bacterium]
MPGDSGPSKWKIGITAVVLTGMMLLAFGRSYRFYSSEPSPDGKYLVEIHEIVRYREFSCEAGYHDALIHVKDKRGNILHRMYDSPAIMCPVSWRDEGVLVGGAYYKFE